MYNKLGLPLMVITAILLILYIMSEKHKKHPLEFPELVVSGQQFKPQIVKIYYQENPQIAIFLAYLLSKIKLKQNN